MRRICSAIDAAPQADIWVMHPATQFYDERKPLPSTAIDRVRGVDGVEWAEPLYVGGGSAMLPGGRFANVFIFGVDRNSKIALPRRFESGKPEMIEQPDAVFWDNVGLAYYKSVKPGDRLQINDRTARVVGLISAPRRFAGGAAIYTTYERALQYSPGERNRLSFVVAKVKPGEDPDEVAERIRATTGLGAHSTKQFYRMTMQFVLKNTGMPINFGITVLLGLIVGVAIAGQTFYSFTVENVKHFGTLKAMGVSDRTLNRMVLLQAGLVGVVGWGLGAGAAAVFGANITDRSSIAFLMTPHLLAISFGFMILTMFFASFISIRRVKRIEPAIVFR
jgi:putative ABC transport system permease protein